VEQIKKKRGGRKKEGSGGKHADRARGLIEEIKLELRGSPSKGMERSHLLEKYRRGTDANPS